MPGGVEKQKTKEVKERIERVRREHKRVADWRQGFEHMDDTRYSVVLNKYKAVPPDVTVLQNGQVKQEPLGCKERKRQKKAYKNIGKEGRILGEEEMATLLQNGVFSDEKMKQDWEEEKYGKSKISRKETLRQLNEGDYSNFENLDDTMRNMVATKRLREVMKEFPELEYGFPDVEAICDKIKERRGISGLMDPALRLGLSLAKHTPEMEPSIRFKCEQLDEAMSTAIMVATLTKRTYANSYKEDLKNLNGLTEEEAARLAPKEIAEYEAQQIQIAKRLLLIQLSDFKVYQDDGTSSQWSHSSSVALSHCSRVVLTMPTQESGKIADKKAYGDMWKSIFETEGNTVAQDKSRASSTHDLSRRKVGQTVTKEKKVWFNLIGQRGMNCAIGGLGNKGVSGKMIRNNGSCGHFYSMYSKGTEKKNGAILFGLESDATGVTNQMGHKHDAHATPEKASSLGAQRRDEIGKKYGGRQCDLSKYKPQDITAWMNGLEKFMKFWQKQPGGLACDEPAKIMRDLAGERYKCDFVNMYLKFGVPEPLRFF